MTAARLSSLLARLLLSAAVVTCLLGLPQASAAAFTGSAAVAGAPAHEAPGHGAASAGRVAPAAPSPGHQGHDDAAGVHAIGCMSAVGILAFVVALGVAVLQVRGPETVCRQLRARARAGLRPRPPSLAHLGILRV